MHCMRCGVELPLGQEFCKECLLHMESFPVEPGTPVVLPPPPLVNPTRRIRKTRKPEEQLSRMRRMMIGMTVVFMIILLAGTMLICSLFRKIDTLEQTITTLTEQR